MGGDFVGIVQVRMGCGDAVCGKSDIYIFYSVEKCLKIIHIIWHGMVIFVIEMIRFYGLSFPNVSLGDVRQTGPS